MKRMIPIALILAAILCHSTALQADTTITYQGRLDSGGQPHTGTVGMIFELYDEESGGSQQGPTLNQSVQVSGGLFQAELDFGEQFYEEGRWLQITVNGQHLSPRQRITGAPFALGVPRLMWALVDLDGTILNQSGGISAQRINNGFYLLDFGSPVAGHALSATTSMLRNPSNPGTASATPCGGPSAGPDARNCNTGPNQPSNMLVVTEDASGADADRAFYIVVYRN